MMWTPSFDGRNASFQPINPDSEPTAIAMSVGVWSLPGHAGTPQTQCIATSPDRGKLFDESKMK
jgi:hypothetical protein